MVITVLFFIRSRSLPLTLGFSVLFYYRSARFLKLYVANHTTIIDYVLLLGAQTFAVVGQKHPRALGFFQDNVLKCLDCIWFDRNDIKDRAKVRDRISEHVKRDDVSPLLIFPEGTVSPKKTCVETVDLELVEAIFSKPVLVFYHHYCCCRN